MRDALVTASSTVAEIAAGTKRIEYRRRTPYWRRRLEGRRYDTIQFRNGYATKAPEMLVEWCGIRKYGAARDGFIISRNRFPKSGW